MTVEIALCVVNAVLSFTALFENFEILEAFWKTPSSPCFIIGVLLASPAVSDAAHGCLGRSPSTHLYFESISR